MENTQKIDGDLAVGRSASIAEDAHVRGSVIIDQNLTVSGWLDAPSLRTPAKGLFPSAQDLARAYPHPRAGWWALVGNSLPADVYIAEDAKWVGTGQQGGQPTLDCQRFESALSLANESLQALSAEISALQSSLQSLQIKCHDLELLCQSHDSAISQLTDSVDDLQNTVADILYRL